MTVLFLSCWIFKVTPCSRFALKQLLTLFQQFTPSTMNSLHFPFHLTRVARVVSLALASVGVAPAVMAQTVPAAPVDLGTIGASTAAGAYRPREAAKGTASAVAPTQASLQATQPQSIITREFIDLSVAPTAEYGSLINIAPSLSGTSTNGQIGRAHV